MTAKQEKQKKPRNLGRAHLVGKLRDAGLSRRKSLQCLNCIFEEMGQALRADKEVDFPLGRLKVVPHQHRRQEGIFLGRKRTIYRQPYTVVHEADERGDRLLNPRPKPSLRLPPKPAEKKADEKMVSPQNRTMRGIRRREKDRLRDMEPSKVKPITPGSKSRSQLPPRPKPMIVNLDPTLGPVGLPLRPGVKRSGQ